MVDDILCMGLCHHHISHCYILCHVVGFYGGWYTLYGPSSPSHLSLLHTLSCCRLSWRIIHFAWAFVTITSLIATYFVMLYGLKFGYNSSLEWLVSFITAFFDDAVIFEPVQVTVIAFLFIFILRRPHKYGSSPTTVLKKSSG